MKQITIIKRSAVERANALGHNLSPWFVVDRGTTTERLGSNCTRELAVDMAIDQTLAEMRASISGSIPNHIRRLTLEIFDAAVWTTTGKERVG